ncbi:MAG: DUF4912 domain-containing protein [Planctomycetales bacterium]
MTPQSLKNHPRNTLEAIARRKGIAGYHAMRKEELVRAILKVVAVQRQSKSRKETSSPKPPGKKPSVSVLNRRTDAASLPRSRGNGKATRSDETNGSGHNNGNGQHGNHVIPFARNLAQSAEQSPPADTSPRKDQFVVIVRGPYWLQAHWNLTPESIRRAEVALGVDWHAATPHLRLMDVTATDLGTSAEVLLQSIPIHGGVQDWYIPIEAGRRSYRLQIGYQTNSGRFFAVSRSNVVSPPLPGSPQSGDEHWSDLVQNCEQVYAMSGGYTDSQAHSPLKEVFEHRLQRSMAPSAPLADSNSLRNDRNPGGVSLQLKTEVVIYGTVSPNAQVTFEGKPVKLDSLSSFRLRMPLNEGRHILPVVATNTTTSEQQTVILAIERNLKQLDLRTPDPGNE